MSKTNTISLSATASASSSDPLDGDATAAKNEPAESVPTMRGASDGIRSAPVPVTAGSGIWMHARYVGSVR